MSNIMYYQIQIHNDESNNWFDYLKYIHCFKVEEGIILIGLPANLASSGIIAVSYTHLTLPTKRIV